MRITLFCRLTVLKNNVFQLILTFSDLKFNNNDNKDYKELPYDYWPFLIDPGLDKAARLTTYIYVNVIILSIVFTNDDARNSRLRPGVSLRE